MVIGGVGSFVRAFRQVSSVVESEKFVSPAATSRQMYVRHWRTRYLVAVGFVRRRCGTILPVVRRRGGSSPPQQFAFRPRRIVRRTPGGGGHTHFRARTYSYPYTVLITVVVTNMPITKLQSFKTCMHLGRH